MKIGFTGIDLPEGKVKYNDPRLTALEEKDKPKKVVPFFAEFIRDEMTHVDVIAIPADNILDLLILDLEKIETRLSRVSDDQERQLLLKSQELLENETPLCEAGFTSEEAVLVRSADPLSLKPVIMLTEETVATDSLIESALEQSGYMFFYTSGPTESHAWLIRKGSDIISCAARIHSDLARGFIKGDVVTFADYMACHNFNDCKKQGLAKVVERDFVVEPGAVIEIRFNV